MWIRGGTGTCIAGTCIAGTSIAVAIAVVAAIVAPATPAAARTRASPGRTVRCVGTGDFCGATVGIAGGAVNRVVTIELTDTDFSRIGIKVFPRASAHRFAITDASYRLGGSEYRFTLNAARSNPPRSRIVLLFSQRHLE
jgi:hypothetical protein